MSTQENKAIFQRATEEIFNNGNYDVAEELYDKNYVGHFPPDEIRGPQGMKEMVSQFRNAFPDLKITIENQIAEGDMVASQQIATGTHKGEFQGIAPTGKTVKASAIVIGRFADGKFIEAWTIMDSLGLLMQLGVIPPPK